MAKSNNQNEQKQDLLRMPHANLYTDNLFMHKSYTCLLAMGRLTSNFTLLENNTQIDHRHVLAPNRS